MGDSHAEMAPGVSEPLLKRSRVSLDVEQFENSGDECEKGVEEVPKPRGSASSSLELPLGPCTYLETFGWPEVMLSRALEQLQPDEAKSPFRSPEYGVQFTSSYTGMGMAEVAALVVKDVLAKSANIKVNVEWHAQADTSAECRSLHSSKHVFSDLADRVADDLWEALCDLQSFHRDGLIVKVEAGEQLSRPQIKLAGDRFLKEACSLLNSSRDGFKDRAPCVNCNRMCRWSPPPPKKGEIWVEVAGNTCTPWSVRGKSWGWLDVQSLPALVWAFSLKFAPAMPDIIINECVPSFPAEAFFSQVFPGSVVRSTTFSPVDLGLPVNRLRRYSLIFPKQSSPVYGMVPWDTQVLSDFAFRKLHLRGSVFFQASPELVKEFMDELAAAKQMPPRHGGKTYACEAVMQSGDKIRMNQYKQKAMEGGYHNMDLNIDVAQTVNYGGMLEVLPTFVRNSSIYNFHHKRLMMPLEQLSALGLPFFLADDHPLREAVPLSTLEDIYACEKKPLKSMIGNAMHLAQVGAALLWAFLHVSQQELG